MDAQAQLKAALDQPAGSAAAQLGDLLSAFFALKLGRTVEGGGRSWDLTNDAHVDAMFHHVAGGEWATALVQRKEQAPGRPELVALAFRDAPFSDVQAYAAINSIPLSRMLDARLGRDAPEALLELARTAPQPRAKLAALAAAVAASTAPAAGLEAELYLEAADPAPLLRKALRALGPARASAVAVRSLDRLGNHPEDKAHCLRSVLECFCAELEPAWPALAARAEQLGPSMGWGALGEYLGQSREWSAALGFLQAQLGREARWRHAVRALLDAWVRAGVPLDPKLDELIDPAGAAAFGGDTVRLADRLLKSLPPERAEGVLAAAPFAAPADALRFIIPGLPASGLDRLALAVVRADPAFLAGVNLRPLGPTFGPVLAAALAQGKPKAATLKSLQRNLDAAVYAVASKPPKPAAKQAGSAQGKAPSNEAAPASAKGAAKKTSPAPVGQAAKASAKKAAPAPAKSPPKKAAPAPAKKGKK